MFGKPVTEAKRSGYLEILKVLERANARVSINNPVRMTRLGDNADTWDIKGDHMGQDGAIHLGQDVVILPDSTIAGSGETVVTNGRYVLGNGNVLAGFKSGKMSFILEWAD